MKGKNIKFYHGSNFYEGRVEKVKKNFFGYETYLVRYTYRGRWGKEKWVDPDSAVWITPDQII